MVCHLGTSHRFFGWFALVSLHWGLVMIASYQLEATRSVSRMQWQLRSCVLSPLTSADRRSEDVRVFPVIVAELEFRDAEWHIFCAHLVERADHAALED